MRGGTVTKAAFAAVMAAIASIVPDRRVRVLMELTTAKRASG